MIRDHSNSSYAKTHHFLFVTIAFCSGLILSFPFIVGFAILPVTKPWYYVELFHAENNSKLYTMEIGLNSVVDGFIEVQTTTGNSFKITPPTWLITCAGLHTVSFISLIVWSVTSMCGFLPLWVQLRHLNMRTKDLPRLCNTMWVIMEHFIQFAWFLFAFLTSVTMVMTYHKLGDLFDTPVDMKVRSMWGSFFEVINICAALSLIFICVLPTLQMVKKYCSGCRVKQLSDIEIEDRVYENTLDAVVRNATVHWSIPEVVVGSVHTSKDIAFTTLPSLPSFAEIAKS